MLEWSEKNLARLLVTPITAQAGTVIVHTLV
jgi:hypothetical protein